MSIRHWIWIFKCKTHTYKNLFIYIPFDGREEQNKFDNDISYYQCVYQWMKFREFYLWILNKHSLSPHQQQRVHQRITIHLYKIACIVLLHTKFGCIESEHYNHLNVTENNYPTIFHINVKSILYSRSAYKTNTEQKFFVK